MASYGTAFSMLAEGDDTDTFFRGTQAASRAGLADPAPTRMDASIRSSFASSRSSSSRPASTSACSQPSRSAKTGPRHNARAFPNRYAARSGSSRANSSRARGHHPLEALRIDLIGRHRQEVTASGRLDRIRTQRLAESHHAALQVLGRRARRLVVPQRIGQLVGAHRLAGPGRQCSQDHPVTGRQVRVAIDIEWAEDVDTHVVKVGASRSSPMNPHQVWCSRAVYDARLIRCTLALWDLRAHVSTAPVEWAPWDSNPQPAD